MSRGGAVFLGLVPHHTKKFPSHLPLDREGLLAAVWTGGLGGGFFGVRLGAGVGDGMGGPGRPSSLCGVLRWAGLPLPGGDVYLRLAGAKLPILGGMTGP